MSGYVFQNVEFATCDLMLDAIAYEYMTGGGQNSPAQVDDIIACEGDCPAIRANLITLADAMADSCIHGLDLGEDNDDGTPGHMDCHNYSTEELAAAMQRFLEARPDREVAA
ncbi:MULTISPECIES: hypothetical protein [unclassified Mameliella]|uniref:hypothetical protein n=1 Tax=Mameliella sp. LZ-28 TaxID=2484146 RepID=UPI00143F09D4|nr:hypothetical protein [Mameliella sp. LZ-28]MCR9276234.1 hypothetical protein [Paracoccaceae bacterium]